MMRVFNLAACAVLVLFLAAGRADTPDEAMEKFIDECNDFVSMMDHCAEGWVAFEQEIIDSVDSFKDRIVYTESLIVQEAGQILEMAGRIVYTEELMFELIETCDCNEVADRQRVLAAGEGSAGVGRGGLPPQGASIGLELLPAPQQAAAALDTCSAMDMALEVMDACMATFETFNDDFLEVLSYLDYAIQDMGDRIVDTECMIMNMSLQIGLMADEVVEVEELTVDMMESCCRNGQDVREAPAPAPSRRRAAAEDDDLLSHCAEFDGGHHSATRKTYVDKKGLIAVQDLDSNGDVDYKAILAHATKLLGFALEKAQKNMNVDAVSSLLGRRITSKKGAAGRQLSSNETADDDNGGMMPCDTWWNPFCCAAEMCADMMAEMVALMAEGMDGMTQLCEDCIDEVGELADAIVDTEEDILVMGYAINDMADCIVLFIDQGLDFMSEFCPTFGNAPLLSKKNPYMRGARIESKKENLQGESCSESSRVQSLKLRMAGRSSAFVKGKREFASTSLAAKDTIIKMRSMKDELKGNPFGDFAEMVDVCMEMMTSCASMFAQQLGLMQQMFNDVTELAAEQAKMGAMVIDMSGDVTSMSGEVSQDEALMLEVTDCMEEGSKR